MDCISEILDSNPTITNKVLQDLNKGKIISYRKGANGISADQVLRCLVVKVLFGYSYSAEETAKEIDAGKKITYKNTIWVSPSDLLGILKPERTKLIQHLRRKKRSFFSELMSDMKRTPASLNNDLKILSKYGLIHVYKEANPGHGVRKVIELPMAREEIEFKANLFYPEF